MIEDRESSSDETINVFTFFFLKAQEKKVKMEEKRKKLAAAAAQLEGQNADGSVLKFASVFTSLFLCTTLLFSSPSLLLFLLASNNCQ